MVLEKDIIIVRQIEIPEAYISLRSDGIIYVFHKENVSLDVELQTRLVGIFKDITGNQKANFIFESDEGFVFTREARENSIKIDDDSLVEASAIIVKSLASRIIANFFIKVTKPKAKYRLFGNVKDAADWLNSL